MATTKISVREFQKILRTQLPLIATDHGWNFDNSTHRGYAFQFWVASVIANFEPMYETSPEDALLTSTDLKADLIMEDSASERLLICQCKYQSFTKSADETEINDFFSRHLVQSGDVTQQRSAGGVDIDTDLVDA